LRSQAGGDWCRERKETACKRYDLQFGRRTRPVIHSKYSRSMFREPKPRGTTQVTKVGEGCHSSQFWYTFRFNVRLRKVLAAKVTDDLLYQPGGNMSTQTSVCAAC